MSLSLLRRWDKLRNKGDMTSRNECVANTFNSVFCLLQQVFLPMQHWVIFLSAPEFLSVYVNMLFIRKTKYLNIFVFKCDKLLNALRKKEIIYIHVTATHICFWTVSCYCRTNPRY